MKTTAFKVSWDNGESACGTFPYEFATEQEAEDFGLNWQLEMNAIDGTSPEDSGYTYEVDEVEIDVPDDGDLCRDLPEYNGWRATYEYPGFINYSHPDTDLNICATSDWDGEPGTLDVQVQTMDGWVSPAPHGGFSGGGKVEWPLVGRTSALMFALLKPFLDEYTGVRYRHPCSNCGATLEDEIENVCATPGEGCCPPAVELTVDTLTTEHINYLRNVAYIRLQRVTAELEALRARIPVLEEDEQECSRVMIATGVALGIAMPEQRDLARARCVELLKAKGYK